MFYSNGRRDLNSSPPYYTEDYYDVAGAEQTPRRGRSNLRGGQNYGSNLTSAASNIQNTQQFLDSLRNLQTLTQNLICAFDQVPTQGINQNQRNYCNPQQVPSEVLSGVPNPCQSNPCQSNPYQPSPYQSSSSCANSPSIYPSNQRNAYQQCATNTPMSGFEDQFFQKRFGFPPPVPVPNTQGLMNVLGTDPLSLNAQNMCDRGNNMSDNADYFTINVPVLLEMSFDGKAAEITKVMHITQPKYTVVTKGIPSPPKEQQPIVDDQQPEELQSEYADFPENSCPGERQRDYSRPLPKPQQKDLKRCVSCPCDECPVYFTDSDIPGCPNDCGCCDCDIKLIKIREAQKTINICKCTGVPGPCKCSPTMAGCTCMKLAEQYLDALEERSALSRPDIEELKKPEEIPNLDTNVPSDDVEKAVKPSEECPPECKLCAEKKMNLNEQKEDLEEEVPVPSDDVKKTFIKCPEECPPECVECAEKRKNLNEQEGDIKEDITEDIKEEKPDTNVPIPPDHVKTELVKCPVECPPECTQCAEEKKNLIEPQKELEETKETKDADKGEDTKDETGANQEVEKGKDVGSKECLLDQRIFGYEIPPNCLKFLQCLYSEMARLEQAKHLAASKGQQKEGIEDEQGKDEKQEKGIEDEKPEKDEQKDEKLSEKEEVAEKEPDKEEVVKAEDEEPQKIEEPIEGEKEQKEPEKEGEAAEKEISEEADKSEKKSEEKAVEDGEQPEKADEEQEEKEVKEEKNVKDDKNKKTKSKSALEEQREKRESKAKAVPPPSKKKDEAEANKGCMCHVSKQKQDQPQRPASFLLELSGDINKILTTKPQKMKSCGCNGKQADADQRRADLNSQIRDKLCSDQPGLGDLYVSTRTRQNQIEASQDSKSCCNKRQCYGYSLDNQLKEFEDKKVNSADMLKVFVQDLSNDIKAMKCTLNRGLSSRRPYRSRFSRGQSSDSSGYYNHSFPASIHSVRPIGSKALLITWVVHSFCGLAGYEIWVDDCCKTRLHASGYDSGCVYGVDVTQKHVIILHPIPTEDYCLRKRRKPRQCLMCRILPDFSEPKMRKPPLPETWTPSIYMYDPICSAQDTNFSNDDGPCCCV